MIEIKADAFVAWLKAHGQKLEENVQRALFVSAEGAALWGKRNGNFKDRTGRLRRSIHAETYGRLGARAITRSNHAAYIENGNAPGGTGDWIYPKKAKYLRFVANGEVVYAKRVRPLKPRKFMFKAREASVVFAGNMAAQAVKDTFRE